MLLFCVPEKRGLDKREEKWEKAHSNWARLPLNYSQDTTGKKKKSKLYQVMFFPK